MNTDPKGCAGYWHQISRMTPTIMDQVLGYVLLTSTDKSPQLCGQLDTNMPLRYRGGDSLSDSIYHEKTASCMNLSLRRGPDLFSSRV